MSHIFYVARLTGPAFAALAAICLVLSGCTTTGSESQANTGAQQREIDAGIEATLSRLYKSAPASQQLAQRAEGILVFPSVLSASFVVGAQYGDGALRVAGKTVDYYTMTAGSVGFQAGAQSKAVVFMFMTPDSLEKFRKSNGWTVGADATVAVAEMGATGAIDTQTMQQPIVGFVLSNAGLMAGVSLQGSKISPKKLPA
jgi:lipid-binding SYLF domain-containing protein